MTNVKERWQTADKEWVAHKTLDAHCCRVVHLLPRGWEPHKHNNSNSSNLNKNKAKTVSRTKKPLLSQLLLLLQTIEAQAEEKTNIVQPLELKVLFWKTIISPASLLSGKPRCCCCCCWCGCCCWTNSRLKPVSDLLKPGWNKSNAIAPSDDYFRPSKPELLSTVNYFLWFYFIPFKRLLLRFFVFGNWGFKFKRSQLGWKVSQYLGLSLNLRYICSCYWSIAEMLKTELPPALTSLHISLTLITSCSSSWDLSPFLSLAPSLSFSFSPYHPLLVTHALSLPLSLNSATCGSKSIRCSLSSLSFSLSLSLSLSLPIKHFRSCFFHFHRFLLHLLLCFAVFSSASMSTPTTTTTTALSTDVTK